MLRVLFTLQVSIHRATVSSQHRDLYSSSKNRYTRTCIQHVHVHVQHVKLVCYAHVIHVYNSRWSWEVRLSAVREPVLCLFPRLSAVAEQHPAPVAAGEHTPHPAEMEEVEGEERGREGGREGGRGREKGRGREGRREGGRERERKLVL